MRINKYVKAGLVFLAITFVLFRAHFKRQEALRQRNETTQLRDVVMARQTIPKWTVITPEMIEVRQVDPTKEIIPTDALTTLDNVQGKVTRAEIMPGRPIAAGELLQQQDLGLSAQIQPGRRAMTIQVSDTTAVSGFLRPGDRVDVLGNFTGDHPTTETLLQAVQIIAVGQSLEQKQLSAAQPNNLVTLAVTPREAELLTLAMTKATLHLILRPLVEGDLVEEQPLPPPANVVIREARHTPSRPRTVRRASTRRTRSRQPLAAPSVGLAPAPTLPEPRELIVPIPPPVPPRHTVRQVSEGPAQPAPAPPQRTVEVIRGTQRETVQLRVTESKVIQDEPVQDQR